MSQSAQLHPKSVHQPSVSASNPLISQFRAQAATRLDELSWPKRTDEQWRFANLKRSSIDEFSPAPPSQPLLDGADEQIEVLTLEEGLEKYGDAVQAQLSNLEGKLGSEAFMATSQASETLVGTCIVVPANVKIDTPISLVREVEGDKTAAHSLTIILAGENSVVSVFERIQGAETASNLAIHATAISAEHGAKTTYALSQELSDASKFVHAAHAETCCYAQVRPFFGNFGSDWVRQECTAELTCAGADCELLGLNLVDETREFDQRTLQHHANGKARSNLLFKNALFGKAKTIFGGLIQVDEGAHQTDSFQTCHNLLLSDEAEANSLPGLEINADQVRCSHGATNGQIDEEQLFYLNARGIPELAARRLITLGFANEVIEKIECEEIREVLVELVSKRLLSLVI
ncbi:MAG: SufD family Fe-S cluster assembly protein [Verrucomicrobiota bacterium]